MKSSFLTVLFLGIAVAACSGTGDRTGAGGDGGEAPTTSGGNPTSSSSSSSSGMGGAGGNGTGGAGGAGGAAPAVSADKLGQACGGLIGCPMGYNCILLDAMASGGFCTIKCGGPTDMMTCSAANGYPGPGVGVCRFALMDAGGNVTPVCGIACGAQSNLPDACPTGLTCQDKFNAMGNPGTDGKNDVCIP